MIPAVVRSGTRAGCLSGVHILTPALPFCGLSFTVPLPPRSDYPRDLSTLGNHLKRCRLDQGLYQKEVAEQLGVCVHTVRNWESGQTAPGIRHWRAIIRFLGYDPHPAPRTLGERIFAARRQLGMTYRELGVVLGVPADAARGWEVHGYAPRKATLTRVEEFQRTVPSVRYWRESPSSQSRASNG